MEMTKYEVNIMGTPSSQNDENAESHETGQETLIKNFGSYTTLHGFHFVIDSTSTVRRILWFLVMIVCLVILGLQLNNNYSKLQSHDSMVTKDTELSSRLLFPAVSICNQNMFQKSKILDTDAQLYLDGLDPLKAKNAPRQIDSSFDIEKVAREAGHNLTSMMVLCSWRGQKCGPENFTSFVSLSRGLCYTFNSGAPGHPPVYATTSGKSQALSLIIDVQPEEYYGPFSYDATGIKLVLHEQHEWLDVESVGIDVTPGYNTNIRIKREKFINLEHPYRPPCGKRTLLTSNTYSASRCLMECNTKYLMTKCNCRFLSLPSGVEFNVSKNCSPDEVRECIQTETGNLNPSKCDCPVECQEVKYLSSLSTAYFPSAHFWDTVYQLLNGTVNATKTTRSELQELIRKRLLKVNIFYESLSTDVTEKKPAYDIHDFTSDVGGSMGLFIGCSLLTFCEFIDLLILVCVKGFAKKRDSRQKIKSVVNQETKNKPVLIDGQH